MSPPAARPHRSSLVDEHILPRAFTKLDPVPTPEFEVPRRLDPLLHVIHERAVRRLQVDDVRLNALDRPRLHPLPPHVDVDESEQYDGVLLGYRSVLEQNVGDLVVPSQQVVALAPEVPAVELLVAAEHVHAPLVGGEAGLGGGHVQE